MSRRYTVRRDPEYVEALRFAKGFAAGAGLMFVTAMVVILAGLASPPPLPDRWTAIQQDASGATYVVDFNLTLDDCLGIQEVRRFISCER